MLTIYPYLGKRPYSGKSNTSVPIKVNFLLHRYNTRTLKWARLVEESALLKENFRKNQIVQACTQSDGVIQSNHIVSHRQYTEYERSKLLYRLQFILSGCTHATYLKILQHTLEINAVSAPAFLDTIRTMCPVVKAMVDEQCKEAMKHIDVTRLGSWNRAVTTADGAWMTRGYHSKNFTFSVRNNCALLFRKHLCQRGRDSIIQEPLYEGTSKGAEGYGLCS